MGKRRYTSKTERSEKLYYIMTVMFYVNARTHYPLIFIIS